MSNLGWKSHLTFVIVRALVFFTSMFSPRWGTSEDGSFWYQEHFLEALWNIASSHFSTRLHRKAQASSLSAWSSTMLWEYLRSFSPYEKVKYEENCSFRWQQQAKLNRMMAKREIMTITFFFFNTCKCLIEREACLTITHTFDWLRERCGLSQYLSYDLQVSQIARASLVF